MYQSPKLSPLVAHSLYVELYLWAVPYVVLNSSHPSTSLVRMGLPYRLAYTVTTALNLIPTLQAEAGVIRDAQRLRAFQAFEKGTFLDKLKAYPPLVTPLIIGAMRRAQLMAIAMDSRAFGSGASRTYIQDIRMRVGDWLFVGFSILYAGAIAAARFLVR